MENNYIVAISWTTGLKNGLFSLSVKLDKELPTYPNDDSEVNTQSVEYLNLYQQLVKLVQSDPDDPRIVQIHVTKSPAKLFFKV